MQPIITTQSGAGTTRWVNPTPNVTPANITLAVVVNTPPVTYTVNVTDDDPNQVVPPNSANPPNVWPVASLTSGTTSARTVVNQPCMGVQMVTTGTGVATLYVLQAGIRQG